jgi:ferredoxin--NADP+ reductase/benzoate/toluate 1,2-dioxygenase reductase subunit
MAGTLARTRHQVLGVRNLTDSTYVLRFERGGIEFDPGQYVSVGIRGDINMREYSVYSPVDADYLEILVKEVDNGHVSRLLRKAKEGDELEVDGPFGFFLIPEEDRRREILFVATGTGISPFHCFAGSLPGLDYTLLHGVRTAEERYEHEWFEPSRVTTCLSRDPDAVASHAEDPAGEQFVAGRVTDYLREHPVNPDSLCYLCGNCDMIYEAFDVLKNHGVPPEQLFAEVYF